jgi:hypothetical protein
MEMGAFTGALVALLAKDMASAIASEMGKDVSGAAAKQVLRRLGQRLRREPDTRAGVLGIILAAVLAVAVLALWSARRRSPSAPVPGATARRRVDLSFARCCSYVSSSSN